MNQMMAYYKISSRSTKWWKRIYYFLLEATIHNSYLLQKQANFRKASFLNFKVQLLYELAGIAQPFIHMHHIVSTLEGIVTIESEKYILIDSIFVLSVSPNIIKRWLIFLYI
eukprot:TRINITY_DN42631_c0_g1_i1.p4 TRINITY_DN42631_c0_g1~~TRINITY_DN42631_c0_g1_i1.p4  ORF type:complete len:112 (+),score=1.62 TRINITY_DN42631_c0_g1_i1:1098-1433(+)